MGLSKSSRVRNSAKQVGSNELSRSLATALRFLAANQISTRGIGRAIQQAVQLRVWLERMQQQLQKTAAHLRDHPSALPSVFQETSSFAPIVLSLPAKAIDGPRRMRRLFRRVLEQGSTLHRELVHLNAQAASASREEIPACQRRCLALGRRAQRLQNRVQRLHNGLDPSVPLYGRMLALQAQRFHALSCIAEDTSRRFQRVPKSAMSLMDFCRETIRAMHKWLMHPLVDTRPDSAPMGRSTGSPYTLSVSGREPSEPAS